MELFDLVDKQDTIIGVTNKRKAHAAGELHRVAAVYVFDQQGKLYVQVHKGSGGLYDHSVGGHVSQGETYEQGAQREAEEELGIAQPLEKLSVFYSDETETMQHMFGLFACIADDAWQFQPNDEVEEVILMDIEEIQNLMKTNREKFTGGFVNTMKEYQRLEHLRI